MQTLREHQTAIDKHAREELLPTGLSHELRVPALPLLPAEKEEAEMDGIFFPKTLEEIYECATDLCAYAVYIAKRHAAILCFVTIW